MINDKTFTIDLFGMTDILACMKMLEWLSFNHIPSGHLGSGKCEPRDDNFSVELPGRMYVFICGFNKTTERCSDVNILRGAIS
jgi:hypothetical protein